MSTLLQAHCERLKAEVGTERTERLGTIRHGDIARFAVASHAPPPRPGPGEATAPPLFLSSVMGWGLGRQSPNWTPTAPRPPTPGEFRSAESG